MIHSLFIPMNLGATFMNVYLKKSNIKMCSHSVINDKANFFPVTLRVTYNNNSSVNCIEWCLTACSH